MSRYLSKNELYIKVALLRKKLGVDYEGYPINTEKLILSTQNKNMAENDYVIIQKLSFKTNGLRGMAVMGEKTYKDIILLNSQRDESEQNFDCAHELIHLSLHRNEQVKTFNCFEKVKPNQNKFLEWQANEGAAELIVPYRLLLPKVKEKYDKLNSWQQIRKFKEDLAIQFNVTGTVMRFRLESLKYEIEQYVSGTKLDDIEIISNTAQTQKGVNSVSLNQIEEKDFFNELNIFIKKKASKTKHISIEGV